MHPVLVFGDNNWAPSLTALKLRDEEREGESDDQNSLTMTLATVDDWIMVAGFLEDMYMYKDIYIGDTFRIGEMSVFRIKNKII